MVEDDVVVELLEDVLLEDVLLLLVIVDDEVFVELLVVVELERGTVYRVNVRCMHAP